MSATEKGSEPRFEHSGEKTLVGKRKVMSLTEDKTFELWKCFMPASSKIEEKVGTLFYSIVVYPRDYFKNFNPHATFEKWAAVEVASRASVPVEMESIVIPEGPYAVFVHKGTASAGAGTFQYIFGTWLPASDFLIDNRPHLAVMGESYGQDDPDSEEEIWIPIKLKGNREDI